VSALYSRGDHVHPTDTSRAAVSALPAPATVAPLMDGAAAVGVATKYAREDHVHPTDTSRAPLASPSFTGNASFAGNITAGGTVTALNNFISSSTSAILAATGAGSVFLRPNGALSGAGQAVLNTNGALTASQFYPDGGDGGFHCKAGDSNTIGANYFNLYWSNGFLAYVDKTYAGTLGFTSDYRTKKDVEPLPGTWETVKALRPIKYTQAEFSPPSHLEKAAEAGVHLFVADDIERWGFIAHELQETMIQSAATGVKDQADAIQSPNPWTIIAALTRTLQEVMTRIEALEAKG
jgi:hypothetical protein